MKFHWKPKLGMQSVVWDEAVKINGADPDFHRRDLWDAISSGDFPEWELGVQVFDDEFADAFDFDVLDATKLIPEELVPVRPIGRLVLDRVVDNFFAETEQVAFCTQNIVPGIDFTNDPLLQGRNFSYLDTQLKRLGSPNFTHLPINAPKCPFAQLPAGRAHGDDQPGRPRQLRAELVRPATSAGPAKTRTTGSSRSPAEEAGREAAAPRRELRRPLQPGPPVLPRASTRSSRQHIVDAFVFELSKVERPDIRERMVANLRNVDERPRRPRSPTGSASPTLPAGSDAGARGRSLDLPPSPALSILANAPDTFAGRKVGVLVTDGAERQGRRSAASGGRAPRRRNVEVIAPDDRRRRRSTTARCSPPDQKIGGGPSVLYDAVAIVVTERGAARARHATGGQGLRHRRPRPLQVHRLRAGGYGDLRRHRARRADGRRLHRSERTQFGPPVRANLPDPTILAAPHGD